eukprot:CAMPEP_0116858334 /NCGR_PEP_ID=MMETSP0418-20121206/21113_1 /TAXON_ID=1158023 /ORGANISM="Astrosyne radiata, Strain 13vi08-1A" /LENGTH=47 /DNA_ID= /DNA_START= /DNA_END= /DNA_ORIENTATION=
MTVEQKEGTGRHHEDWEGMVAGRDIDEEGDMPRLWVEGEDYPGCAFT